MRGPTEETLEVSMHGLLVEGPVVSILSRTKEAERAEDEHLGTHSVFDNPLGAINPPLFVSV
jgi:hypothetical protein